MLPNWLYGKSLRKLQEILNSGGQTAAGVSYSNTESGLEATNAQTAIDEVVKGLNTKVDWDNLSEVGSVNDLNNTAITKTINGVTFTVNDDKSITVNSTNGATSDYTVMQINFKVQKTGQYKVLLDKLGTSRESIYYSIESIAPSPAVRITRSYDGNEIITLTEGVQYAFPIYCRLNVPITNKVIYPFFTSLLDYNGPYVPYAKSNKELTEDLSEASTTITENGITATFNKWGKTCTLTFGGAFNAAFNHDVPFLNIPSGFAPKYNTQMLTVNKPASSSDRLVLNIMADATITVAVVNVASGDALRGSCTYIAS